MFDQTAQHHLLVTREGRWSSEWTPTWYAVVVKNRPFAPSACCSVDRLKLVPATDHRHSCCILNLQDMRRSLHDLLPSWQRDVLETGHPNPVNLKMPVIQLPICLPWWLNTIWRLLKSVIFFLSFLPTCRKRPLPHSTTEYYMFYFVHRENDHIPNKHGSPIPKNHGKILLSSSINTFYLYCFNFKQNSNSITNSKLKPFSNPEGKMCLLW